MRLLSSAAALAAASLLLVGCSSNPDSGSTQEGAAAPQAADLEDNAALEDDAAGEAPPAQIDTGDRAVIYEATLEVEDDDPEGVAEAAWDLAESFGGFVTADERDRSGGAGPGADEAGYSSAHLVLRIPSEQFTEAMDGLVELGERERHRSVTTEDVTEATVDLASHIATKRASVERVRGLLAEATSVDAILELESDLAQREGELASLESQLENLRDRVALSTIDFTVATPYASPKSESEGYAGPDSFWDGLGVGFSGAMGLLIGISVVIGVLLPFLPLAAVAAAAVIVPIRLARKRREGSSVASIPADATAGPASG
jgi:hypothetical protein